ncbi:MAG: hypothetical protein HY828_17270 [Actinobacteria bacterium]|nr:hypothetical protein [Actinomycetota bacterium]
MSRATKRLMLTMALTLTVATATAIVVSASDGRRESSAQGADRDDDHSSRECPRAPRATDDNDDRRRPSPSTSTTTTSPDGQLLPSFLVGLAPTTFVKVDRSGRIVEAATNTSCRPARGDTVYVFLRDGTIITAPHLDLDAIDWRGSFRTPGVYHRQRGQRGCLQPTPCHSDRR